MTTRPSRSRGMTRMAPGAISPKVTFPSYILAAAGIILAGLDAAGVFAVEDKLWLMLLGAGGVTFGAGYSAPPGDVITEKETP
jgi:hypothetical protein